MRTWLKEVQGGDAGGVAPPAATAGQAASDPAETCSPTTRTARPTQRSLTGRPSSAGWRRSSRCPLTALDTETTSLDPFAARIVGVSLAVAPGEAAYLPLAHDYPGVPPQLPRDEVLARCSPGWNPRTPRSART
jgi:DNA polymerase-1